MLKIIDEDDFIEKCRSGRCLRQTIKSKQCEKESKQRYCYKKYVAKKEKEYKKQFEDKDYRWEDLKEEIKLRDSSCLFTKIATMDELRILESREDWWISKFIDGAHVVSRAEAPSQIYNVNNVILLNRYIHSKLDQFINPITLEFMGLEGKALWFTRIMQENNLWDSNYDYWNFKKDITGKI
jgi:hypothetical protein